MVWNVVRWFSLGVRESVDSKMVGENNFTQESIILK